MFLIGHSIGVAVTATIASAPRGLRGIGIALSAIGVGPPAEHGRQWNSLPQTLLGEMPQHFKD
jgi:hypothetical protein